MEHDPSDFLRMCELARKFMTQSMRSQRGTISIQQVQESTLTLHELHSNIYNAIGDEPFLHDKVIRKFYTYILPGDLNNLRHSNNALNLTEGEFCIILHRIIMIGDSEDGMGDVLGDDLPYRSKSWVDKCVKMIYSKIDRYVDHENFDDLRSIMIKVFDIIDTYEVMLNM